MVSSTAITLIVSTRWQPAPLDFTFYFFCRLGPAFYTQILFKVTFSFYFPLLLFPPAISRSSFCFQSLPNIPPVLIVSIHLILLCWVFWFVQDFDRNLTFDIFVNSSQLQWSLESRKKKLMEWWDDCSFAKMLVILRWSWIAALIIIIIIIIVIIIIIAKMFVILRRSWNAAGRQALIRPDLVFIRECTRRMQPCFQFGQMNLFLKIWF